MGSNQQGATIEQLVPWINKLLDVAGMFALPEGTTPANILDRLNVLFSQIDGKSDNTLHLNGVGEVQCPEGAEDLMGSMAMSARLMSARVLSNRLRPVTSKERDIQNRAAELARSRRVPYFRALEIVRGIRG